LYGFLLHHYLTKLREKEKDASKEGGRGEEDPLGSSRKQLEEWYRMILFEVLDLDLG